MHPGKMAEMKKLRFMQLATSRVVGCGHPRTETRRVAAGLKQIGLIPAFATTYKHVGLAASLCLPHISYFIG